MNLCLINSAPGWGGGERLFLELAVGLQQSGHAVTVVCRPGSVLAARLGGSVDVWTMRCASDVDVITTFRLWRLFARRHIDAVFCNLGRDCLLAGLAAVPCGIPVVRVKSTVGVRGDVRDRLIYHRLLSTVVSVSQAVQDGLAGLQLPANRLRVIYNGVDVSPPPTDRATARAQLGVSERDFVVAYVGRLVREKGPDLLPEVAARLVNAGMPLQLVLLGDGPLRGEIEAACATGRLSAHMRCLGFVDDPLTALVAADAAVVPSRSEAFCIAAVEALAMGTPLVACRVGGLAEIVADEDTALLVPPDDADALADALLRLARHPELAAHLRARGRERAQAFSRQRMVEAYEHLAHQLHEPVTPQPAH